MRHIAAIISDTHGGSKLTLIDVDGATLDVAHHGSFPGSHSEKSGCLCCRITDKSRTCARARYEHYGRAGSHCGLLGGFFG